VFDDFRVHNAETRDSIRLILTSPTKVATPKRVRIAYFHRP
jgi:hypothetical protein